MDIETLFESLMLCREAKVTPFVWGHGGIGKSSTVKAFAEYVTGRNGKGPNPSCIDFRCAQMEASDIRGIPTAVEGRTKYLAPSQLPIEDNAGVLFLDEINRAEDDVLHAMFELVLDRSVGEYKLPPSWSIICAGNYNEGDYTVNAFNDFAFLDRFCHLELTKNQEYNRQWARYIKERYDDAVAAKVVQYITGNIERMLPGVTGDLGFTRRPTPRSWEAVIRVEGAYKKGLPVYKDGKIKVENGKEVRVPYSEKAYFYVLSGLVGTMALEYINFTTKIFPTDIIEKGVKANTDILDSLNRGERVALMWGISASANLMTPSREDKGTKNILDFIKYMAKVERDLALMLIRGICKDETKVEEVGGLMAKNKAWAAMVGRVAGNTNTWTGIMSNDPQISDLIDTMNIENDVSIDDV